MSPTSVFKVGVWIAIAVGFAFLFFVVGPQSAKLDREEQLAKRADAWEFGAMCISEGRKPTECMEACAASAWPEACRAWIMDRSRVGKPQQ